MKRSGRLRNLLVRRDVVGREVAPFTAHWHISLLPRELCHVNKPIYRCFELLSLAIAAFEKWRDDERTRRENTPFHISLLTKRAIL